MKLSFGNTCASKPCKADTRAYRSRAIAAFFSSALLILLLPFCVGPWQAANAQWTGKSVPVANAPLNAEEVVENLVGMNVERAHALHSYHGTRTYQVEYRGFPGPRSAEMVVEVKYQSPDTKEFSIQSTTGSKLILDKVFKKLLQAETEVLDSETQKRTALNGDNYNFRLVGYEPAPSGSMYVLRVSPKRKDKFLYSGRIWVNVEDFAVVRLEAEPAKNPSFWTKNSEIEQMYTKVGDFWLPARNHSMTLVRLGGRAEMTIQYSNYKITSADAVGNLSMPQLTESAYPRRTQP